MKIKSLSIFLLKFICLIDLLIILSSCVYIGLLKTGLAPLPTLVLDYLGKKEEDSLKGVILANTDSQLSDPKTYSTAMALYELIEKEDEARFEGYTFDTVAELKKVVQCLNYEIFNGDIPEIKYIYKDDSYHLSYISGEEAIRQHREATDFINEVYATIEAQVGSLETESEKAEFIAKYIKNDLIKGYDYTFQSRTIYSFMNSADQVGVCSVYTMLFDRLCEKAGFDKCYMVIGSLKEDEEMLHCWNKLVFSDSTVHYYDLTNYYEGDTYTASLINFDNKFYTTNYRYRELTFTEYGYRVGFNMVAIN